MLDTVFYFLLNMSITASFIGLLLMVLRLNKKISTLGYALWGLVFARLVIPFAFSSKISILNLAKGWVKKVVDIPVSNIVPGVPNGDKMMLSHTNYIGAAESYYPFIYRNDFSERFFRITAFVWFIVAITLLLLVAVLYSITASKLGKVQYFKDNIFISDSVRTPMVFGLFKPKIIIPPELKDNPKELEYVLLHENVHIKKHDNLLRLIGIITACIHWFNPFVWVFLKLFLDDMELVCDLKAVKHLSMEERKDYARTLVNLSSENNVFMSAAFGRTNVRTRVLNVINYKSMTVLAIVISTFFIAAISAALITNPIK